MIVGMDFGTTNSGMAVYDGHAVNVLPLDPSNTNPRVARTAVYITNEQAVTIGRAAVDRYFEHNIGRPVRMQKIWVGELEVIADLVYFVTDVYVWADALSPGRLFLSIKTGLRDVNYPGTVIGQFYYTLEDLIALYLSVTKARAERLLDREIHSVVLGRPVHFAADAARDRVAEARLLRAAFLAGYETVYLQYEPVAAAYSYALELRRPENALVFDFGGGTLDITVMRLGEDRPRVLATGGIPIAGDVFDQKLVRAKLPRHFGEGSLYGPRHKALTVPQWVYDSFADWQAMLELQSAENKQILREIAQTAQRKYQIDALLALVSSNYGLKMFDIVEGAKRVLSDKRGAEIRLSGPGFDVREFVTRGEFETIIHGETRAVEHHLLETVRASGLRTDEIDSVIRTGGSALIPAFYQMLARHFGEARVRSVDTFSSVTAGLGIIAHQVDRGEAELIAHTPSDFAGLPEPTGGRLKVKPVNLVLLQRRIALEEHGTPDKQAQQEIALVLLGQPTTGERVTAELSAVLLPTSEWAEPAKIDLLAAQRFPVRQALLTAPDAPLLLVTSRYRFFVITARQLADLEQIGQSIGDLHQLAQREAVTAVADWTTTRERERLLIVTSTGFARAYPLDTLRPGIEGPVPMQFDNPLPGVPVLLLGASRKQTVAVVTEGGRGVRWSLADIPLTGVQAINCGQGEAFDRVTAATVLDEGDELLLLLEDGYARRLKAESVFAPPKPNAKGRSLTARSAAVADITSCGRITFLTDRRLATCEGASLPLEASTKTYPLLKLVEGERVMVAVREAAAG